MSGISEQAIVELIASAAPVEETLPEVVARLARLPPLEYDRQREAEARRFGVRLVTLDAEVALLRTAADDHAQPHSDGILLSDAEPWPEPVDGQALLDELADAARRYLILPDGAPETIALWILHCHLHATAAISPILAITSPSPECGKTTLLDLLGALVPRPLPASNITAAALFRAVEKWTPTMLVDEADTFLRDSDDLRGVLNSGHRRSAAYVVRTVGEDHEPRQFRTWAPKAIALIGKLPATLASRSIEIGLRRKTAKEQVEPLRGDRLDHLEPVRQRCTRFAADAGPQIMRADPIVPEGLHGRAADNWRHMFAIADVVAGEWPAVARRIAVAANADRSEETTGIMLLHDIRLQFAERYVERLTSAELAQALGHMEDRPWAELKNGSPLTVRHLARLLEPFKIRPVKFRAVGQTPGIRGYERANFADAFARYLPDDAARSATAPQATETAASALLDPPRGKVAVADQSTLNTNQSAGCGAVADRGPGNGEAGITDADWDALAEERAAIMEYDGGYVRKEAEVRAAAEIATLRGNDRG
jgi:putative DNA primase/helicase